LNSLKKSWNLYIKKRGEALIQDTEKDKTMVEELLNYKDKMDLILSESFSRNDDFVYALKEAFETFINSRQNTPAELLAKYVDSKLRTGKSSKSYNDSELDIGLDKVMQIFRYINGKDVFEAFYKKDLAKRLLLNISKSVDAEKSMIAKLKTECGSGFTNKLEGMFKDIELSSELMSKFKGSSHETEEIDMKVFVLTTGFWPPYSPIVANLPIKMTEYQEIFTKFYLDLYGGRKLIWQNSLGQCLLKASFPSGRKELSVSLFQTIVLLLFNDSEILTYQEIASTTGIQESELHKTLQSLSCGKVRVLNKEPAKSNKIQDTDKFIWKRDFQAKLKRIKINQIQTTETQIENQKNN